MPVPEIFLSILYDRKSIKRHFYTTFPIIGFGLVFLFMASNAPNTISSKQLTYSGCSIIFCALIVAFNILKKLRTRRPVYFIDSDGIHHPSGILGVDPILWKDFQNIIMKKILWKELIAIEVKDPQTYINNQRNPFKKLTMSFNHIFYNSPFCITSDDLDISINRLFEELTKIFNNSKKL